MEGTRSILASKKAFVHDFDDSSGPVSQMPGYFAAYAKGEFVMAEQDAESTLAGAISDGYSPDFIVEITKESRDSVAQDLRSECSL